MKMVKAIRKQAGAAERFQFNHGRARKYYWLGNSTRDRQPEYLQRREKRLSQLTQAPSAFTGRPLHAAWLLKPGKSSLCGPDQFATRSSLHSQRDYSKIYSAEHFLKFSLIFRDVARGIAWFIFHGMMCDIFHRAKRCARTTYPSEARASLEA